MELFRRKNKPAEQDAGTGNAELVASGAGVILVLLILLIFILAAIFSPPDVFSQLLLAVPTYILFEVTLLYYAIRLKKEDCYETIYRNQ